MYRSFIVMLLLLLPIQSVLAAFASDTCAGADPLAAGNPADTDTTTGRTPETLGFCGTSDGTGGAVWYTIFGTGGLITLDTCGGATNYDSKIRVFTDGCGTLTCVTGNDDACGLQSSVTFGSTLSQEYQVVVHGFSASEGNFDLGVTAAGVPPAGAPISQWWGAFAFALLLCLAGFWTLRRSMPDRT